MSRMIAKRHIPFLLAVSAVFLLGTSVLSSNQNTATSTSTPQIYQAKLYFPVAAQAGLRKAAHTSVTETPLLQQSSQTTGPDGLVALAGQAATAGAGPAAEIDPIQLGSEQITVTVPENRITVPEAPAPRTGASLDYTGNLPASPAVDLPEGLASFAAGLTDWQDGVLRGLYVEGILALRVVPQPGGDPGFVAEEPGSATEFQSVNQPGVTGLLAHNFLDGALFYQLDPGVEIDLIYGDGSIQRYRLIETASFERLDAANLSSDFRDLETNTLLSAAQVFERFYRGEPHLTLQTCLEKDGYLSWGVTFFVAAPIE